MASVAREELTDWLFPDLDVPLQPPSDNPCGSTDPYFWQCGLDYGHAEVHNYTIEPPEEYWEDEEDLA